MKNIKVNFIDGDYLFTTINGSESEIINYYNFNNFYGSTSKEYIQVENIEFLYGENKRIYLFNKVDDNLYLY